MQFLSSAQAMGASVDAILGLLQALQDKRVVACWTTCEASDALFSFFSKYVEDDATDRALFDAALLCAIQWTVAQPHLQASRSFF